MHDGHLFPQERDEELDEALEVTKTPGWAAWTRGALVRYWREPADPVHEVGSPVLCALECREGVGGIPACGNEVLDFELVDPGSEPVARGEEVVPDLLYQLDRQFPVQL